MRANFSAHVDMVSCVTGDMIAITHQQDDKVLPKFLPNLKAKTNFSPHWVSEGSAD
jgi:hypothetical protein